MGVLLYCTIVLCAVIPLPEPPDKEGPACAGPDNTIASLLLSNQPGDQVINSSTYIVGYTRELN